MSASLQRKRREVEGAAARYGAVSAATRYPRLATVERLIGGDLSILSFSIAKEWRRYWQGVITTTRTRFAKRFLLCIVGGEISRDEFMLHFYLEYVDPFGGRNRHTKKIRRRMLRIGMVEMVPGAHGPISHVWDTFNIDSLPTRQTPDCLYPIVPRGKGTP